MERERARKIAGAAMIGLGLLQAGLGVGRGDLLFSAFGITYALLGTLYLWSEVYAAE